ncbi:MAG: hypothetical protein HY921_08700 [Elusimicrobia bacterium]|nr:hypothetical protein [Elusimicrobiota bacterium]
MKKALLIIALLAPGPRRGDLFAAQNWAWTSMKTIEARLRIINPNPIFLGELRLAFQNCTIDAEKQAGPLLTQILAMEPGALKQRKLDAILYVLQEDFGVTWENIKDRASREPNLFRVAEIRAQRYLNLLAGDLMEIMRDQSKWGDLGITEPTLALGRLSKFYLDFLDETEERPYQSLVPQAYREALQIEARETLTLANSGLAPLIEDIERSAEITDTQVEDELRSRPTTVLALAPQEGRLARLAALLRPRPKSLVSPKIAARALKGYRSLRKKTPPDVQDEVVFAKAFIEAFYGSMLSAMRKGAVPAVILPSSLNGPSLGINSEVELAVHSGRFALIFADNEDEALSAISSHHASQGENLAVLPATLNDGAVLKLAHPFAPENPYAMSAQLMRAYAGGIPPVHLPVGSQNAPQRRWNIKWKLQWKKGPWLEDLTSFHWKWPTSWPIPLSLGIAATCAHLAVWSRLLADHFQAFTGYIEPYHVQDLRALTAGNAGNAFQIAVLAASAAVAVGIIASIFLLPLRNPNPKPLSRLLWIYAVMVVVSLLTILFLLQ